MSWFHETLVIGYHREEKRHSNAMVLYFSQNLRVFYSLKHGIRAFFWKNTWFLLFINDFTMKMSLLRLTLRFAHFQKEIECGNIYLSMYTCTIVISLRLPQHIINKHSISIGSRSSNWSTSKHSPTNRWTSFVLENSSQLWVLIVRQ